MVVNIDNTEIVSLKKDKKKKKKEPEEEKLEVSEEADIKEEKKKKKKKKDKKRDSDSAQELKEKKKKKKSKKRKRDQDDEEDGDSPVKKKAKKSDDNATEEVAAVSTPTTSSKSKLSSAQIQEYRDTNRITVDSSVEIVPYITFDQVNENFDSELVQACCGGFEKPSPIQSHCWPVAKSGKDLVGIAETGSGKTLAFLLPGLANIMNSGKTSKEASILVLAPTRELAMQSAEVCNLASQKLNTFRVRSMFIGGGTSKDPQRQALRKGVEVIVATPGRLLDLVQEGSCSLNNISYVVLDEADRMLDMGFEKDIRQILQQLPKNRQTLMFSATWPEDIQALAASFLRRDRICVTIGSPDLSASHRVQQIVEEIEPMRKDQRLRDLLNQYHRNSKSVGRSQQLNRVLVFCLYKKEAARVEQMLQRYGWPHARAIHGDMSQIARNAAFEGFKSGEFPLLVATDVAARGLDIPDVEYVLNYTFPLTVEDYVHRIGRTGRAGKEGIAHTFFTVNEKGLAGELVQVLKEANQPVPEGLLKYGPTIKKKKDHAFYGQHYGDDQAGPAKAPSRITFDD